MAGMPFWRLRTCRLPVTADSPTGRGRVAWKPSSASFTPDTDVSGLAAFPPLGEGKRHPEAICSTLTVWCDLSPRKNPVKLCLQKRDQSWSHADRRQQQGKVQFSNSRPAGHCPSQQPEVPSRHARTPRWARARSQELTESEVPVIARPASLSWHSLVFCGLSCQKMMLPQWWQQIDRQSLIHPVKGSNGKMRVL